MTRTRLAVWGDPIGHSRSPALHAAAYAVLGLDWEYGRRRVDAAGFDDALSGLDKSWRGLSLTMPLKEQAFAAAVTRDRHAGITGAVNTLLLGAPGGPTGFNTDVGGIVDALREAGIATLETVRIIGAGATAASALVAVTELSAAAVDIRARRPEKAAGLVELGERLGVAVTAGALDADVAPVDLTLATLPSGTDLDPVVSARLARHGGTLFDAAYAPWPSALARAWGAAPVVSGFGMLLYQAVRQIRIFRNGEQSTPLPEEALVVAAMRASI